MKVGEEELKARITAAQERRKKIKDLKLAVIEGHLLIEESLDECIRVAVYHPEPLKSVRLTFYNKGMVCASLCYRRDRDEMWPVLWAVNHLRNTIAHNLDSEEIDEKVKYLRKVTWTRWSRSRRPMQRLKATSKSSKMLAGYAPGSSDN